MTKDNQTAPWILFEAGALSKTVEKTNVVPYLIDLEPAGILPGPLTQFQAKRANKAETWELIRTINRALDTALSDDQLQRAFERCWPELERSLNNLPELESAHDVPRSSEDMIAEVLEGIRRIERSLALADMPKSFTDDQIRDRFLAVNSKLWSRFIPPPIPRKE